MPWSATISEILQSRGIWTDLSSPQPPKPAAQKLCWHCCHPFEGPPRQFPKACIEPRRSNRGGFYAPPRSMFKVCGHFCSWECVKAYSLNQRSSVSEVNIRYFYKKCTGNPPPLGGIRAAPPREELEAFGGTMSIDEFRRARTQVPGYCNQDAIIKEEAENTKKPEKKGTSVGVEKKEFKLQRNKPLGIAQNRLERSLGWNALIAR